MTMLKINVHEAKTHLSRYLEKVKQGEIILLCNRNQPIAEIRPIETHRRLSRPIGLAKEIFAVPDSFFEELPEEIVAFFRGEGS
jgi:prevent-host-death family protein